VKNVLCFGDSITRGTAPVTGERYPRNVRYTGILQSLLGEEYLVIEEGLNGRTCLIERKTDSYRNAQCYVEACIGSHQPVDYMIVMLGSNDAIASFDASADYIAQGMRQLVGRIIDYTNAHQGGNLKLILCCPPETNANWKNSPIREELIGSKEKTHALIEKYRKIADDYGIIFFNTNDYVEASKEDSVHLNADMQRKFAEAIAEVIRSN